MALLIVLPATAQQSCPKWGPYVKTVGLDKNNNELMMADVMIPTDGLANFTYACSVQFGIGKSGHMKRQCDYRAVYPKCLLGKSLSGC